MKQARVDAGVLPEVSRMETLWRASRVERRFGDGLVPLVVIGIQRPSHRDVVVEGSALAFPSQIRVKGDLELQTKTNRVYYKYKN
jgi:hypothetical protein